MQFKREWKEEALESRELDSLLSIFLFEKWDYATWHIQASWLFARWVFQLLREACLSPSLHATAALIAAACVGEESCQPFGRTAPQRP